MPFLLYCVCVRSLQAFKLYLRIVHDTRSYRRLSRARVVPAQYSIKVYETSLPRKSFMTLLHHHSRDPSPSAKTFRPPSTLHTVPRLPICSSDMLLSVRNVRSSAWFARKRWLFDVKRPTMCPRLGVPSRAYSTV